MTIISAKSIITALRLPFVTASIFPYIAGALLAGVRFDLVNFILGLAAVIGTHLSANMMNDYSDSRSGADWHDKRAYLFFGGSKLIQENVLSEKFYLYGSLVFAFFSFLAITVWSLKEGNAAAILIYIFVILSALLYSSGPVKFSYRKFGEAAVFILFGPVTVMGAFFLQTKIFPDPKSFMLSLIFGFLTVAVLFANEVPDYRDDIASGKLTLVSIIGREKSYICYICVIVSSLVCLATAILLKLINPIAAGSLVFSFFAVKATNLLKNHYNDKLVLVEASKSTILFHSLVSIFVIIGVVTCTR